MNPPLQKAGIVLTVLFALLFLQLNWIAVVKGDDYRNDTRNNAVRILQMDYERQRGNIVVDGKPIAFSISTADTFRFLRTYPSAELYAHVTGYRAVYGGITGIEAVENQILNGSADEFTADRLLEMFTGKKSNGGNVLLSLNESVQRTAYEALLNNGTDSKIGAVVALEPTTGAILGMVSTPSFDPNTIVAHNYNEAEAAYQSYNTDLSKPLLNRALSNTYPPGSTFKVIVAAEALERGLGRGSVLPAGPTYTAPGTTTPVGNAPGVVCGDEITLENALRISCNTAFARFCVEQAGADAIKAEAREFGFESVPLIDRDDDNHFNVAPSHTGDITSPAGGPDLPALAQSCIGQRDVRWTPLQAALVAATIANDGVQKRPYLIETIQDANLAPLWHVEPRDLGRPPISSAVAKDLRQMMQAVVDNGTGRNARIEGFEVGGKTGTAQNDDAPNHGWFIGYARTSSGQPVVAVAVLIQNAGSGGSAEAAKIAGQVMEAALVAKSLK